jgi:ankyrin repeat protein
MNISLHKAVKAGDLERVKTMVKSGADLNQKNIYGRTPLAVAEQFSQAEIAEFLRRHGGKQ